MEMTYLIQGLDPAPFRPLFALDEAALAGRRAKRVTATERPGFPCRVSLEDAEPGESLIMLHHVSHEVETPFRSAYAIYVREQAEQAAVYADEIPPAMCGRTLALRAFDGEGILRGAALAGPGEADAGIRTLFGRPEIATIHAHNAAAGCFAAKIVRD
jgi:hypothetical protein